MALGKDDSDSAEHDMKPDGKQEMFDIKQEDGSGGGKGDCSMVSSESLQVSFKSEGKHESCGKEIKLEDKSDGKMEAHLKQEAASGDIVKMENGDKLDSSVGKSEDGKSNSLDGGDGGTTTTPVAHDAAAPAAGTHVSTTKPRCKKSEPCVF